MRLARPICVCIWVKDWHANIDPCSRAAVCAEHGHGEAARRPLALACSLIFSANDNMTSLIIRLIKCRKVNETDILLNFCRGDCAVDQLLLAPK